MIFGINDCSRISTRDHLQSNVVLKKIFQYLCLPDWILAAKVNRSWNQAVNQIGDYANVLLLRKINSESLTKETILVGSENLFLFQKSMNADYFLAYNPSGQCTLVHKRRKTILIFNLNDHLPEDIKSNKNFIYMDWHNNKLITLREDFMLIWWSIGRTKLIYFSHLFLLNKEESENYIRRDDFFTPSNNQLILHFMHRYDRDCFFIDLSSIKPRLLGNNIVSKVHINKSLESSNVHYIATVLKIKGMEQKYGLYLIEFALDSEGKIKELSKILIGDSENPASRLQIAGSNKRYMIISNDNESMHHFFIYDLFHKQIVSQFHDYDDYHSSKVDNNFFIMWDQHDKNLRIRHIPSGILIHALKMNAMIKNYRDNIRDVGFDFHSNKVIVTLENRLEERWKIVEFFLETHQKLPSKNGDKISTEHLLQNNHLEKKETKNASKISNIVFFLIIIVSVLLVAYSSIN